MLTAIGYHVVLKLKGGRSLNPKGVLFFDFSGKDWPKSSLLIGNRPEGHPSARGRANRWFGSSYEVLNTRPYEIIPGSKSELLRLSSWKVVGPIERIRYERGLEHPDRAFDDVLAVPTVREPRNDYKHDFERDRLPILYQRGRFYRIQLQRGTVLNMRGLVEPGQ